MVCSVLFTSFVMLFIGYVLEVACNILSGLMISVFGFLLAVTLA